MAFFCQVCQLRKSVTPNIIFREFSGRPRLDTWWSFLLGFVRRLSLLPDYSLHLDILLDHIADARGPVLCAKWARGIEMSFATLGMASPLISFGIDALNGHGFMTKMAEVRQQTWFGLHVSPRTAPSKGDQAMRISSLNWPSKRCLL